MAVIPTLLTPWPESKNHAQAAAWWLAEVLCTDSTTAGRIGEAASALVEAYASGAPEALRREAMIRVAGWLLDTPSDNLRGEQTGELRADYAPSMRGAMLHSGAKSLLYPWRTKTAGVAR